MNLYVVVEGEKTEPAVYKHWIRYVNPSLHYVDKIDQVVNNNFYIISGMGYPFYLQVIEDAIEDVNSNTNFDRLVISVDSEDLTYNDKRLEIGGHIATKRCRVPIYIIIQHFCLETWALANKSIIGRNIQNEALLGYINFYNVFDDDPEGLPPYKGMNRSQFALKYLKKAINEKSPRLTYSKNNPEIILNNTYFNKVRKRHYDSKHISSFNDFLVAFR
jgi:hypothetical protein